VVDCREIGVRSSRFIFRPNSVGNGARLPRTRLTRRPASATMTMPIK
jgi:hypothetical protein